MIFLNNPEYIKIDDKKIKINTDFRIALKCQEIATDPEINDIERAMAIIYLLFGKEALEDEEHYEEYLQKSAKFLACGKEMQQAKGDNEPIFDYKQDWGYIKASFMSDYQIDLDTTKIHWWTFFDLLNGLTKHSKLVEVMRIRNEPLDDKKGKERSEWIEAKKSVALKRQKTKRELELDERWKKMLNKEG